MRTYVLHHKYLVVLLLFLGALFSVHEIKQYLSTTDSIGKNATALLALALPALALLGLFFYTRPFLRNMLRPSGNKASLPLFSLVLGVLCFSTTAQSQNATVSYNSTGTFTVCGSAQTNSLSISNGNAATMTNILATLQVPPGGTYVAGSITGATESNITNLNAPVFSVPNISASNSATITYQLSFGCAVISFQNGGGLTKETVDFTYNLGASAITDDDKTTPSTYNVLAASLSITAATNTNFTGNVGDTYSQELTIVNGGLGCTSSAFVKLDRAGGTFSFTNPSIGTISNDTLFLAAADMPGGDNQWCNSESLVVSYDVTINNCTTLNRAAIAGWGCFGSSCQVSTAQNSNVIINNVTPLLASSVTSSNLDYCFAGENQKQTIRITNTGAGPATNIRVRHSNFFPGQFLALARFDTTANWELRNSSGTVIGSLSRFTILTNDGRDQANDFLGIGCTPLSRFAEIEVPLNIILAPGDYIEYDVWMTAQNLGCYQCSGGPIGLGFRSNVLYSNQCGTLPYTTAYTETVKRSLFNPSQVLTGPVDVAGNVPFNLSILINHNFAITDHLGRGRVFIAIPTAGLDLSTTATSITSLGVTLAVETRNDTIFIGPFPDNVGFVRDFNLPLTFACGTGGPKTIESFYLTQYNDTCSPVQKRGCTSYTIDVKCSVACPKGGATPLNFALRRINFGQVDNDNNGIPDASGALDMNLVKDHNSVNGDTLRGTWNIKVFPNMEPTDPNFGLPFNHLYVDFKLGGTSPAAAGTLTALPNATATIFPAGGGASTTCTVSPTITNQIAHYDFSACKATWVSGDSLVVNALYTVNENNNENYGGAGTQGLTLFVTDNQVYTTYLPQATPTTAPINGSTYTCQSFNDYNQMAKLFLTNSGSQTIIINGCINTLDANAGSQVGAFNGGDVNFPYEYRNFFIPDTLRYTIPTGFLYRPTTARLGTTVINDANVLQVGNVLYFTNLKSLYSPYGGTLLPGDEQWDATVTFSIDPSCDAAAGGSSGSSKFMGVGNGLNTPLTNYGVGNTVIDNIGQNNISFTNNPAIPLLAGGGTIVSNTGAASWSIQLQNLANNADAANSFFYIQPSNSLSNIVIREQPGNTVISPDANGYYRLGSLLRSANRNFTVTADLSRCGLDSMRINFGNACLGYPTTPFTVQSCTQFTWLRASGFPASLDVTFDKLAPGTVDLCTPLTLETVINSTLVGNLDNEVLKVVLPTGMNYVPGSVQVVYPVGGAYTANAYNPTIVGDTAIFAVNSLTGGMGLTGVSDLTRNRVGIRFDVISVCGFISGSSIKAIVTGSSVCGDPVPTVVKTSSAISITGASATTQYAISVVAPNSVSTCGRNGTITVNVINTGTTNPPANDSLTINLSNGLSYVAGSFVSLKNAPSSTVPVQMGNLLRWQIPSTVAPGDSMKFTITLAGNSVGCGMNTLDLYTTQSIALPCGGMSCNTPVITGRLVSDAITTICCVTDLATTLTISANETKTQFDINAPVLFSFMVFNQGVETPASDVVVTNYLPSALTAPADGTAGISAVVVTDASGAARNLPNLAVVKSGNDYIIDFGSIASEWLQPGDKIAFDVQYIVNAGDRTNTTTDGIINTTEISSFDDDNDAGTTAPTDVDSTPDATNESNGGETIGQDLVDNATAGDGKNGGDEDDHDIAVLGAGILLPVELVRFQAQAQKDYIGLSWTTASELNNDRFEVERSEDAKLFKQVGQVKGQGTTLETTDYSFDDKTAIPGVLYYYRLKQVDTDGTFEYSELRVAQLSGDIKELLIYPSPLGSGQKLNVRLYTENARVEFVIADVQNRVSKVFKLDVPQNGWNIFELDIQDLPSGTYFITGSEGQLGGFVKTNE